MAPKAKTKSTSKKTVAKSATRAKASPRTTAKRATKPASRATMTATRSVAKTAKAVQTSPLGKAAAKVLAGAAAGAVRAIIPQLEDAAGAQEQAAGGDTGTHSSKARKPRSKA